VWTTWTVGKGWKVLADRRLAPPGRRHGMIRARGGAGSGLADDKGP